MLPNSAVAPPLVDMGTVLVFAQRIALLSFVPVAVGVGQLSRLRWMIGVGDETAGLWVDGADNGADVGSSASAFVSAWLQVFVAISVVSVIGWAVFQCAGAFLRLQVMERVQKELESGRGGSRREALPRSASRGRIPAASPTAPPDLQQRLEAAYIRARAWAETRLYAWQRASYTCVVTVWIIVFPGIVALSCAVLDSWRRSDGWAQDTPEDVVGSAKALAVITVLVLGVALPLVGYDVVASFIVSTGALTMQVEGSPAVGSGSSSSGALGGTRGFDAIVAARAVVRAKTAARLQTEAKEDRSRPAFAGMAALHGGRGGGGGEAKSGLERENEPKEGWRGSEEETENGEDVDNDDDDDYNEGAEPLGECIGLRNCLCCLYASRCAPLCPRGIGAPIQSVRPRLPPWDPEALWWEDIWSCCFPSARSPWVPSAALGGILVECVVVGAALGSDPRVSLWALVLGSGLSFLSLLLAKPMWAAAEGEHKVRTLIAAIGPGLVALLGVLSLSRTGNGRVSTARAKENLVLVEALVALAFLLAATISLVYIVRRILCFPAGDAVPGCCPRVHCSCGDPNAPQNSPHNSNPNFARTQPSWAPRSTKKKPQMAAAPPDTQSYTPWQPAAPQRNYYDDERGSDVHAFDPEIDVDGTGASAYASTYPASNSHHQPHHHTLPLPHQQYRGETDEMYTNPQYYETPRPTPYVDRALAESLAHTRRVRETVRQAVASLHEVSPRRSYPVHAEPDYSSPEPQPMPVRYASPVSPLAHRTASQEAQAEAEAIAAEAEAQARAQMAAERTDPRWQQRPAPIPHPKYSSDRPQPPRFPPTTSSATVPRRRPAPVQTSASSVSSSSPSARGPAPPQSPPPEDAVGQRRKPGSPSYVSRAGTVRSPDQRRPATLSQH